MIDNQKFKNYTKALRAFFDGKPVQVWAPSCAKWINWPYSNVPMFNDWVDFRAAPETYKCRLAFFKDNFDRKRVKVAESEKQAKILEESSDFIKWLGDWQEIEI